MKTNCLVTPTTFQVSNGHHAGQGGYRMCPSLQEVLLDRAVPEVSLSAFFPSLPPALKASGLMGQPPVY